MSSLLNQLFVLIALSPWYAMCIVNISGSYNNFGNRTKRQTDFFQFGQARSHVEGTQCNLTLKNKHNYKRY